jgi:hypothetical protein
MLKIYQKDKRYLNIYEWGKVFDRRILVLTGFVKADVDIDYFYKLGYFGDQRMVSKISKEQIDKVIEIKNNDALYREKYIDDIIDAAKKMPNYGFIIKLHPVEINSKTKYYDKLKDIKNIYIISEQIPIGGLWEIIDVMIHYNSTCNMEAYIYGVPTIFRYDSIRKDNLSTSELLIHESTYPIEINDNKGLIECLQGDISYKRIYATEKKLYELFNWKRNKEYKPSEKIAKYICKASKSQKLLLNDKEVKKAINSIEFETIYNNLITNWISKATIQNSINLIKLLCLKILCKK